MTDSVNWTCPTCNVLVRTHFCAHCGEEPLARRDLTSRGLGEKMLAQSLRAEGLSLPPEDGTGAAIWQQLLRWSGSQ